MSSNIFKLMNRAVGKAIHRYDMIADKDRVLVGLSGGKDSLALLWMLHHRKSRVPIDYRIDPVYIDPGFKHSISEPLKAYCRGMGYSLRVEYTDFGLIGHSAANRENPCFLCARLRRKRLFEIAGETACNKVALGHHKDDIIETLFLNMCYSGEISTMVPSQSLFSGELTVIRPLAFLDERAIRRFACEKDFPEFVNPCPTAGRSHREVIKEMLHRLYRSNEKIKGNIFRAMSHVKRDYLLK